MVSSEHKVTIFILNIIIAVLGIYTFYWVLTELDAPQPIWFVFILYLFLSFLSGIINSISK